MNDAPKVWIRKRATKNKLTYHLRWICPVEKRWKSRLVGTDIKRAQCECAKLQESLEEGSYRADRRIAWAAFVTEHLAIIAGSRNREESERTLREFGTFTGGLEPRRVTFADVERYLVQCREVTGNSAATVNKKRRYLVHAFNRAADRGYVGHNPAKRTKRLKEQRKKLRILSLTEQAKVLAKVDELYGTQLGAFVRFLLSTGARRAEAFRLAWEDVSYEDGSVLFRNTKSAEDRYVPVSTALGVLGELRKLQAKTLLDGGPFRTLESDWNLRVKWLRVLRKAEIPHISFHDLRRTYITRLAIEGIAPAALMKIVGHKNMQTTMRYYVEVSNAELKRLVLKATAAG